MANNQRSQTPDARAEPKIEAAMRQIDMLLRLVADPVTVVTARPEPHQLNNWDLVAPAMLFSAASCLASLRYLAEAPIPRRDQDAIVLLRRLYEHAVDFAWIAIDAPAHIERWVASDYKYRLSADRELAPLENQALSEADRERFQSFIDQHRTMPDVATRAREADRHWNPQIEGHGTSPSAEGQAKIGVSLRTMYVAIYRYASANAHPTPLSLSDYISGDTANTFSIGLNMDREINDSAYTMAPLTFAAMLFIAEHVLGRPSASDIHAAFSGDRSQGC